MKISRLQVILIDILALLSFFVSYILSRFMLATLPDCFFKGFGFVCPACGGTRAVITFTSADFLSSFKYNPYIFITIIFAVIALIILNITVFSKNSICKKVSCVIFDYKTVIFWAIGFAIFGIIRNLV